MAKFGVTFPPFGCGGAGGGGIARSLSSALLGVAVDLRARIEYREQDVCCFRNNHAIIIQLCCVHLGHGRREMGKTGVGPLLGHIRAD
jgi:hypothetical protein